MLNNTTAKIKFPNSVMAIEFTKSWSRVTLRGYTISGDTVTVHDVTYRDRQFIDGYVMVENDLLDPNGII